MNPKKYILIVEDSETNIKLLELILIKYGYQVELAMSGLEAIDKLNLHTFDLILLDIVLPDINGLEMCQRLKSKKDFDTPIIFVTSNNKQQDIINGLRAGAVDYLTKPFSPEELLARISAHLTIKQQAKMLEQAHNDVLTVLNELSVASIILNAKQVLEFISDSCHYLLNGNKSNLIGKSWEQAFSFDDESKQLFQEQLRLKKTTRKNITLKAHHQKQEYCLEAEISIDPQNTERRIVHFYDKSEVYSLRQQLQQINHGKMVGHSPVMKQLFQTIEQIAQGDWTVLINGETGTGKELVAKAIHNASTRKNKAFIAINCAGLSESLLANQLFGHKRGSYTGASSDQIGFFEAANGGTLFLDEIGDIPLAMQTHLLRVLQEHEIVRVGETQPRAVDVRIIAATHKDLIEEVKAGHFREDLLYRIRVVRVLVPPLRERNQDIVLLSKLYLEQSKILSGKKITSFSSEALILLQNYTWPGNVRELKSCIDYAFIYCQSDVIQPSDLPPEIHTDEIVETGEAQRFLNALKQTNNNRSAAAKLLGISRATFYRRFNELNSDS